MVISNPVDLVRVVAMQYRNEDDLFLKHTLH